MHAVLVGNHQSQGAIRVHDVDALDLDLAEILGSARLPKRGDSIQADGYTIRVESVRDNRIVGLRIHPDPQ